MSRRLYRVLLRCYPSAFRARFGQDMEETFAADLGEARSRSGVTVTALWVRAVGQAVVLGAEARVTSIIEGAKRPMKLLSQPRSNVIMLLQDIRFALRTFRRNPSFTVVVVATMALGIGASTTIFSVVNGVLLRPLPYPDSDRLVVLGGTLEGGPRSFPEGPRFPPIFADWQENS